MNKLIFGDSYIKLHDLEKQSIDSIITDPPYGINFRNNKWDYDLPNVSFWKKCYDVLKNGSYLLAFGSPRTYHRLVCNIEDAGFEIRDQILWIYGSGFPKNLNTQLKPSHEPIVLAKKKGKLKFLNIDDCKIISENLINSRFPANLIHDGSDCIKNCFPEVKTGSMKPTLRNSKKENTFPDWSKTNKTYKISESGNASRFFYCAKACRKDKEFSNFHPTAKPKELMKYLIKLVSNKNDFVLDPFMGSATTGIAALELGCNFIGIEKEKKYYDLAKLRIENFTFQSSLF